MKTSREIKKEIKKAEKELKVIMNRKEFLFLQGMFDLRTCIDLRIKIKTLKWVIETKISSARKNRA